MTEGVEKRIGDLLLLPGNEGWDAFFENCALGFAVADMQGNYLAANQFFLRAIGSTEADLRTASLTDLLGDSIPGGNRSVLGELAHGHRRSASLEISHRRPDGSTVWLRIHAALMHIAESVSPAVVILADDITEPKGVEETLRQNEKRFHAILDNTPSVIFLKDVEGRYLLVNREFEKIFNVTQADVSGKSDREIFPGPQAEMFRSSDLRVLRASSSLEFKEELENADGPRIYIVHKFPLYDPQRGAASAVGGIATDVSDLVRLQDEVRRERDHLRLLLDLNNSFASNLDLRQLFHSVCAGLRSVVRSDAAVLVLPTPGRTEELRIHAVDFAEGKGFLKEDIILPMEGSIAGRVFRTGEPYLFKGIQPWLDAGIRLLLEKEGLHSGCSLPLIRAGKVLGVLTVASLDKDAFSQHDLDLLRHVIEQVAIAAENALRYQQVNESRKRLVKERSYLQGEIRRDRVFEDITGSSSGLKRVLDQVQAVASTDSTVLITGETGTGKELIARAIHNLSMRHTNAMVSANCASIPAGLLESELFGHEKGAFTGAVARGIGRLELANRGTLFLDEVGDIPLELQPKLLRVLQEREFERLGSTRTIRIDFRLVAATNKDLAQLVDSAQFRSDLFYRMNVFPIHLPPLRERVEDIPLLVWHYVKKYSERMNKEIEAIRPEDMEALMNYRWPGNIRELQNIIERSVIVSPGSLLHLFPLAKLQDGSLQKAAPLQTLAEAERHHILESLRRTGWVIGGPHGAAASLGVRRTTLLYKMRRLGIARPAD